jgi:putative endonuclease
MLHVKLTAFTPMNRPSTRSIGNIGEDIACVYLKKHGLTIRDRNYSKKWGELDIIAIKDEAIHFFEVKSVTALYKGRKPEDNVDNWKLKHMRRAIESYLADKAIDCEFHVHVLCVFMNMTTRRARVQWIKDIIV